MHCCDLLFCVPALLQCLWSPTCPKRNLECDGNNEIVFLISVLHSGLCRLLSSATLAVKLYCSQLAKSSTRLSCGHLCIEESTFFSLWENVSTAIGWIADKFVDVRIPLRMNCNNFGDGLTFHLLPSLGQNNRQSNTYALLITLSYTIVLISTLNINIVILSMIIMQTLAFGY